MLSKLLNWTAKLFRRVPWIGSPDSRKQFIAATVAKIKEAWILVRPPWNLPLLVGLGFVGLGLLMILVSFKSHWYSVPTQLYAAEVKDQSEVEPTKRIPATLEVVTVKSKFEFPCKAVLVVTFCICGIHLARNRLHAVPRAKALGLFAAVCVAVGLAFAHLVIVDEPELSHSAAWIWSQHDGLAWYGGDIYTSREYEVPGGGFDISMKDPPRFLSVVSPPYLDLDLATLNDFLTWAGLCFAFWVFVGKGWAMMMLGSLLLIVGVLCTREPKKTRGLSNKIVISVVLRAVFILVVWVVFVTGRTVVVAHTINNAQAAYLRGDYVESLRQMRWGRRLMPCLAFDSGLMLQEGILEREIDIMSDRAEFAKAYHLESDGYPVQAEEHYLQLMDCDTEPVAREAARYVFRRAVIRYNSGEEGEALRLLARFQLEYPCMPKSSYLRMLIAVRENDFETAQHSLQEIYAVVRNIGIKEARGYCTSGHQHLAQLAFDRDDVVETRRQAIYRAEQQHK